VTSEDSITQNAATYFSRSGQRKLLEGLDALRRLVIGYLALEKTHCLFERQIAAVLKGTKSLTKSNTRGTRRGSEPVNSVSYTRRTTAPIIGPVSGKGELLYTLAAADEMTWMG
jgi:hypothetical protein